MLCHGAIHILSTNCWCITSKKSVLASGESKKINSSFPRLLESLNRQNTYNNLDFLALKFGIFG